MRHHNRYRKFGRRRDQRRALLKSLARELIGRGRIKTTENRAKSLRPVVEKLVSRARRADLASRRLIAARLGSPEAMRKLTNEIAPRYRGRPGGYTRIIKLPPRHSDASSQALIEFV